MVGYLVCNSCFLTVHDSAETPVAKVTGALKHNNGSRPVFSDLWTLWRVDL